MEGQMRNMIILAFALLLAVSVAELHAQDATTSGRLFSMDTGHSILDFTARHIGFGRVRGNFESYEAAAFFVPGDIEKTTFSATIEVGTISTGSEGRNGILSNEFFDSANHPYILFRSTRFENRGDGYLMTGMLSMRDVTREVQIPVTVVTFNGKDQWQHDRIVLEGELTVNRNDYNLVYDNDFWNAIVDDEIKIDISFAARHYNALNTIFPWRETQIATVIREVAASDGLDAALARVRDLWTNHRGEYSFSFSTGGGWNSGFYRAARAFAQEGLYDEAIRILDLAIELKESGDLSDLYAA